MPGNSIPLNEPAARGLLGRLLDLVYPPFCGLCRTPLRGNRWLCAECAAALPRLVAPFCSRCGEPFDGVIEAAFECPNCRDLAFAFAFARPALRSHPASRTLIHDLKYHRHLQLAAELGRLATEALADPRFAAVLAGHWPVVPVPLHWRRRQHRHFNQSAEIARTFARLAGLPVVEALRRRRGTPTQTRLTRHQRLANLRGAFDLSAAGRQLVRRPPPGVIVFDDVFTTGATTDACARVLRRAGIEMVVVVTVLRG
jgi:ComF family protein